MKSRERKILGTVVTFAALLLLYVFLIPKVWLGNFFFGKSDFFYNSEIAQTLYRHAIRFEVRDLPPPYAYYQLSRTHFIEGELDIALLYAGKELEYYPDHYRTYYIKGITLGYMDREREAIDAFSSFLERVPESWAARNDKAWLQFRIGDINGALVTISPAVELHSENPWVMNTYGVLLMNVDRLIEAKDALERAKVSAEALSPEAWGAAYPGNSPHIYSKGLSSMRSSIETNLSAISEKLKDPRPAAVEVDDN